MKKAYNIEPINKYFCKICNTEHGVKGFPSHLKFKHNIEFKNYIKDNIEDFKPIWKICPVCNENVTSKMTCSKKCGYILRSVTNIPRNIWAEMSFETKERAKIKLSESAKIAQKGRNIWKEMSPETKLAAKNKISIKTSNRVKGSGNPMYGRTHTPETIKAILTKRPMTSIEKLVSDFLKERGIDFYFQYFISKDSTHSYDFKIKGIPLIIEVDGDYWHGGPSLNKHFFKVNETIETDKLKTIVANSCGLDVIRFWGSDIENSFDVVKLKILTEIKIRE